MPVKILDAVLVVEMHQGVEFGAKHLVTMFSRLAEFFLKYGVFTVQLPRPRRYKLPLLSQYLLHSWQSSIKCAPSGLLFSPSETIWEQEQVTQTLQRNY